MKNLFKITILLFILAITATCEKDESASAPIPEEEYIIYDNNNGLIGAGGGEVNIPENGSAESGASITIPEGALNQNTEITISDAENIVLNGKEKNLIRFGPKNTTFDKPVIIGVPISGESSSNVAVYYHNEDDNSYEELELVNIDQQKKVAYAYAYHFSLMYASNKDAELSINMGKAGNKLAVSGSVISSLNTIPYSKVFLEIESMQHYLDNLENDNIWVGFKYELCTVNALGVAFYQTEKIFFIYAQAIMFGDVDVGKALKFDLEFKILENGKFTNVGSLENVSRDDFMNIWLKGDASRVYFDLDKLGLKDKKLKVIFSWGIGYYGDVDQPNPNRSNDSNVYAKSSSSFKFENITTEFDSDSDGNGVPDNLEKPLAPTTVTAGWFPEKQDDGIYWKDNSNNEDGFIIEMATNSEINFEKIGEVSAGKEFYSKSFDTNNYYTVRVAAKKGENLSEWSEYAIVPKAPSNLTGTAVDNGIRLTWNNLSDNQASKISIMRGTSTNELNGIAPIDPDNESYTDDNIIEGTDYYYQFFTQNISANDNISRSQPTPIYGPVKYGSTSNEDHETSTLTYEGRTYKTVKIGDQWWMAENLAYLPKVSHPSDGSNFEPYYYVYDYFGTNVSEARTTTNYGIYGVLYNWEAAQISCPNGWRLPTDNDWTTLSDFLIDNGFGFGGSGDDIAKSMSAKEKWISSPYSGMPGNDMSSNNRCGFSGLPAGYRNTNVFESIGSRGDWWSDDLDGVTSSLIRSLGNGNPYFIRKSDYQSLGLSVRCIKGNSQTTQSPSVTTNAATDITTNSATLNGNVTSGGGADIISRGFYWSSTNTNPDENDNLLIANGTTGDMEHYLPDLTPNSTYYFVAWAKNNEELYGYGNPISFTTKMEDGGATVETSTLTYEGQTYNTVKIGDQWWMAENLAYDVGDGCWVYDNNENNLATYGRLYNWEAAKTACPNGWHLPSDNEWKQLELAIGMSQSLVNGTSWRGTDEGTKLKATSGWVNNGNGTDDFGFSALPGGYRTYTGSFSRIGSGGLWWSATEFYTSGAWYRIMSSNSTGVDRQHYGKDDGFSVRCVRD